VRRVQTVPLCLILAAAALVVGISLSPSLAEAVGLDLWKTPEALDAPGPEGKGEDPVEAEIRAVLGRTLAKTDVAREALDGRVTLRAAAARFRDLDADASEAYRRGWRHLLEGASDEERYYRQVLDYAAAAARERSDGPAALDRLRAQFDDALARGDLRLSG
jgi:hypothetical protein